MLSLPKFGAPSGFGNPGVSRQKKANRNKIQEIFGAPLTEQTPIVREYSGVHAMRMIFLADLKSQACPEHFHGVEIKLGVERALDVGGLAEAMLLTREQEIADWCPAVAQRLDHCLSLVRRHYRILVALEEDHRARKAVGVK
jgi:hypothetical protein